MAEYRLTEYLSDLARLRGQSESTPELSLREPLLKLLHQIARDAGRDLLIAPEASAEEAGQPDIFVKDGPRLVGFVETKAPATDLGRWLKTTKQGFRYTEALPNWVLTDYYRFLFIRDGERLSGVEVADPAGVPQLVEPASEDAVLSAFTAFFAYAPPVVRSPQRLALELARRARLLRDGIAGILQREPNETRLTEVLSFYREMVMSDLDEEGFADTFAQTIAYGLFLARLREPDAEFTLPVALNGIPQSIPFLRSAVRLLTDEEVLPRPIRNLLEDLVALLDNTLIEPVRREIAAGGLERDLVVYFYERFLERYDAGERKRRGVYYTPPELVSYLVRAVQTVLVREFELPDGLADDHVLVLDPAVGTGTFVLGAAEQALDVVSERGTASQRRLIREHLLTDFYGFELLPAPYTVAHLKLSSFYDSRGYQLSEGERVRVYLTNSMEPFESDQGGQLSFLPMIRGIVEEGRAAGYVKERVPVLVVLGNPPYERTSHNANDHSNNLLEDFYRIEGQRLSEKNTGPLRDDYLRFIRWSIWKLLEQPGAIGHGILALVTNRAYLERTLHRAVRRFLLRSFDAIHVFDLHGDQREWFADRVDEKVFREVQAGIALTVFVKHPRTESSNDATANVRYREVFGRREEKYDACHGARIDDDAWIDLSPRHPLWLFVPYEVPPEYDTWPRATDLFPLNVVGFQTHRDQLVVAATEEELRVRLAAFANAGVPDEEWEKQGVKTNRDWNLRAAREVLAEEGPRRIMKVTYRGLERRWMAMDERLIDYIRTTVSPHLLEREDNLALVFANGSLSDGPYTIASRTPVPAAALSWRTFGTAYFAPLWIRDGTSGEWIANVPQQVLNSLHDRGIEADAQALFHYVYAVLNARRYRARFAHALRYEVPRIPISGNPAAFEQLRELGVELTTTHLLERPNLAQACPPLDGDDRAVLSAPTYDEQASAIKLAPNLVARNVAPDVWRYQQGAYRVVRDYLKEREGRRLTSEEFEDFRRLVGAVRLTLDLLPALDEAVEIAFQTALSVEALAPPPAGD